MHNINKGKGRSAKCPYERLQFQIFPKVVTILSLELSHALFTFLSFLPPPPHYAPALINFL